MNDSSRSALWRPGDTSVAVVMISLNEAHNMADVLENLDGWAQEVFLVDSHSSDQTVDIALRYGVHVVQRPFRGFGDQWNFALTKLPIAAAWTMKLDPDERLTDQLKREISAAIEADKYDGFKCPIRLFFMGKPLPVRLSLTRLWRTGSAEFSSVKVNEHAQVRGTIGKLVHDIDHRDSPDLHHWVAKQNRYSTVEALAKHSQASLSDEARLLGSSLQRRMWIKKYFMKIPFRYVLIFLYHYIWLGACRSGWVGYAWSRLRSDVYRLWEFKYREIQITGRIPRIGDRKMGQPDPRVTQYTD